MTIENLSITKKDTFAWAEQDTILTPRFYTTDFDELDSIDPIPGFELQLRDGTTLEAAVTRESGVNALFAALSDRGIVVTSLRNKQNRLEQLFIDMVKDGVEMEGHAS